MMQPNKLFKVNCKSLSMGTTVGPLRYGHGLARGIKTHGGSFHKQGASKNLLSGQHCQDIVKYVCGSSDLLYGQFIAGEIQGINQEAQLDQSLILRFPHKNEEEDSINWCTADLKNSWKDQGS